MDQASRGVTYRCLAGHDCPATLLRVRPDGTVDLEVDGLMLTRIVRRWSGAEVKPGECYSR